VPDIVQLEAPPTKLTRREKKFLEAYLGEAKYNGTEAATIAGFRAKSRASMATMASETMRSPQIAARLREHFEASTRSADADLAELDRLAHSEDSKWETPICNKEGVVVGHRFEPRDKVRALEIKLKARGMLSENILIKSIPSTPAELEAALLEHMTRLADADAEVIVHEPKQLEEGESVAGGESVAEAVEGKSSPTNT
jgi:phage terminase small subunit